MKKSIHSVVKDIFLRDDLAVLALDKGLLNTNAYAKRIQKKVEKQVGRKVKVNTITVAINRLKSKLKSLLKNKKTKSSKPELPKIANLEVNTPIIISAFKPSPKLLVAVLNLASDPKYQDSIVYIQYTQDEMIIIYEQNLKEVVNRWNAPLLWENKATALDIEFETEDGFSKVSEALERAGICPIISARKASLGGLFVVRNEDLVRIIQMLSA